MNTLHVDTVILGAGPAGCAAAITARQAGLDVVIFEERAFPRPMVGETLHPGVEPLFEQLGVLRDVLAANFLRFAGQWVAWGSPARFEAFGQGDTPWLGFQADRAQLDNILLERASSVGVQVIQPCGELHILSSTGRAHGVVRDQRGWHSHFTVDATGRRRRLASQLNLAYDRFGPQRTVWFGYAHGSCPKRDEAPLLVGGEFGWTWTAHVAQGMYQWTHWPRDQRALDAAWLPEEFRHLEPIATSRAAEMTWRICRATAGPGYFLVGDAAAVLDPVSGHGVLRALMSGMMAGHLMAGVLRRGLPHSSAALYYRTWMADWFHHDRRRLKAIYSKLLHEDFDRVHDS
jgi:flavin-dependent dehydrogenase